MRVAEMLTLFDYLYWVNGRILDAAERLGPEGFIATSGGTTRDLRATLVHELDVEWSWRLRLQDRANEDGAELSPDDYPDIGSLRDRWRRDEAEMRAWLATLSDDQFAAAPASGAVNAPRPLWQYLLHIVMHAAQQQADAATLLTAAGESPGEIGFLEYLQGTQATRLSEHERGLRIGSIVLRCADRARLEAFWTTALDYVPAEASRDVDFIVLRPRDGIGPNLSLDEHRSELSVPPRIHLDLYAEDQPAEVERLIGLGATRVEWSGRPPDADYVILADPEGNRFCVVDTFG